MLTPGCTCCCCWSCCWCCGCWGISGGVECCEIICGRAGARREGGGEVRPCRACCCGLNLSLVCGCRVFANGDANLAAGSRALSRLLTSDDWERRWTFRRTFTGFEDIPLEVWLSVTCCCVGIAIAIFLVGSSTRDKGSTKSLLFEDVIVGL